MKLIRDHLVSVERTLIRLCLEAVPSEACGVVWNDGLVTPAPNVAGQPNRYAIKDSDMMALLAARPDNHIYAIYHSHPSNRAKPSVHDVEMMIAAKERGWDIFWVIVALSPEDATTHLYSIDDDDDVVLRQHLYYRNAPTVPPEMDSD